MFKSIESGTLKSAALLLAFGLVIGIWMGFNPTTHKQIARSMSSTEVLFARLQTDISTTTHKWATEFKASEKTTAVSKNTTKPNTSIWQQISDTFASWWKALQAFWQKSTTSPTK